MVGRDLRRAHALDEADRRGRRVGHIGAGVSARDRRPGDIEPDPPGAEPSTGWISPEGEVYACNPWMHSEAAGESARPMRIPGAPWVGSREMLEAAGWLHVGRLSHSDHARTGGTFVVVGEPTERQAALLLAWLDAGASIVHKPLPGGAGRHGPAVTTD